MRKRKPSWTRSMSGRTVCVYVYNEKENAETSTMNGGMVLTRYCMVNTKYVLCDEQIVIEKRASASDDESGICI